MEEERHEDNILVSKFGLYDPELDLSSYQYPGRELIPDELHPLLYFLHQHSSRYQLLLILNGKDFALKDLYQNPNVLLAGTIASGKTQFIYNQLVSWLFFKHPAEIKFVICRSKVVDYNSIGRLERHFMAKLPHSQSALVDVKNFGPTLTGIIIECKQRLDLFANANVKNIKDYNSLFIERRLNPEEGHRFLPDIVLVIDDLYNFLNDEDTELLIKLTQQNLYTGIYCIGATSQINARTLTSQLRANFSFRISMKLMSRSESRKILDKIGAESLNPPGEMLYEESGRLIKAQQPFIPYSTIESVCNHISQQRGYPSAFLLPEYIDIGNILCESLDFIFDDKDALFEEAARLIVAHQQGSTSLIQRQMKLGYNRAGRIIDQLESAGIVGPFEISKARDVLYPDQYSLELYLDSLEASSVKKSKNKPKD